MDCYNFRCKDGNDNWTGGKCQQDWHRNSRRWQGMYSSDYPKNVCYVIFAHMIFIYGKKVTEIYIVHSDHSPTPLLRLFFSPGE